MRPSRVIALFVLWLLSWGSAERITFSAPGDSGSLEVRNAVLPDGTEVQYYVLRGRPVTIKIGDDQEVVADHIEIDFTNDLVRVIGFGTVTTSEEAFSGENLVVDLNDESFTGRDVLIVTEAIDVIGIDANRVPGQIDVLSGRFSPCSRCNQQVQDFGFRARRLELYPGDRLVGFNVTIVIREVPVFFLPILVVPLAPPERQPRLTLRQGTLDERANVFVDWPYVSGANALGTFSVRYYADVRPGEGNFFTNGLLGGRPRANYIGGGINHRFFTETGGGAFDLFFVPSFIEYRTEVENGLETRVPDGKTRNEFTLRFRYDTAPEIIEEGEPSVSVLFERDDARAQRVTEYGVTLGNSFGRFRATVRTQGFVDLDPEDDVDLPSYDGSGTPLRTPLVAELEARDTPFSIGPFRLSSLRVNVGAFEDQSNPINRSAATQFQVSAGRLLEQHLITLDPIEPWRGLSISGRTDFLGQYYSTDERLIDWNTQLDVNQSFGGAGNFNLSFVRDINEGETPFLFDRLGTRGNLVALNGGLNVTPLSWLSFSTRTRYVFVYEVRPDATGFDPVVTSLRLFENSSWFSLSFENTYDVREEDPGILSTRLSLRSPGPEVNASLDVTYNDDLYPIIERNGEFERDNDSDITFTARYGLGRLFEVDFSGGRNFEPPLPEEDEVAAFWKPFELGVTLGTSDTFDAVPGVEVRLERDLNEQETDEVDLNLSASVAPFEVSLQNSYDFEQARRDAEAERPSIPWSSTFTLTWRDVAVFEMQNFPFIRPELVGLEVNPDARAARRLELRDALPTEDIDWRATFRTTLDPTLDTGPGYTNSSLELAGKLLNQSLPGSQFGVELAATWRLRDDVLDRPYLDNLGLSVVGSFYDTVGVQGRLSYDGLYRTGDEELSESRLTIEEVAFTVKLFDQLYISSIFNDVWDFTESDADESPYNFQPELRVTWDRCCWALYGSWDTETGAVSITLTTPGATQGFSLEENTSLLFPRAPLNTTPEGDQEP